MQRAELARVEATRAIHQAVETRYRELSANMYTKEKALRKEIMKRDHYTCQMCGKFMPDEVGLHIDHIVPIAKGGKTVPSNLQVLCSKCNGAKGAKTH